MYGCCLARSGSIVDSGSKKCSSPATFATGSCTATAMHEPSACVTRTLSGSLLTRQSAIPTVITFNDVPQGCIGRLRFTVYSRAHKLKRMLNTVQALRMPNEKVCAGFQKHRHSIDDLLLCRLIEIDHYVAATDERKYATRIELFNQIEPAKFDNPRHFGFDPVKALRFAVAAQQIFGQPLFRHLVKPLRWINACARFGEGCSGDVRGKNTAACGSFGSKRLE